MAFSITARPLLGTYRGHRPDGTVDSIPSVDRLFNALLSAAGFGPRAVEREGGFEPSPEDLFALRWMEVNPPTEVVIPSLRVNFSDAIAYRNEGTLDGKKKGTSQKKFKVRGKQDSPVAVDGAFVWIWRTDPPSGVVEALAELCCDIPTLGTSESPMLVSLSEPVEKPTHVLDPNGSRFSSTAGYTLTSPTGGRIEELSDAYSRARLGRRGSDKTKAIEKSHSPVPSFRATRPLRFREVNAAAQPLPWTTVYLVPLDLTPLPAERVRWCVAAHKTLVKLCGASAPASLTGITRSGSPRPANHVALQVLDSSMPIDLPDGVDCVLAVMMPAETSGTDTAVIVDALSSLRALFLGRGSLPDRDTVRATGPVLVRPGGRVWRDLAPGAARLWTTYPAAVPDTRGRKGWGFAEAALLSLGFVWQGTAFEPPRSRGAQRDSDILSAIADAGVEVFSTKPYRTSDVAQFVHHTHVDAVVRPYRATIDLGQLAPLGALVAIGQSRHLGGGLLVPDDRRHGPDAEGS